jgi:micrococcal nuclease
MQFLRILLAAGIAVSQTAGPSSRSPLVLVKAVTSGDAIDVADVGRVRLLGIDAPKRGRGASAAPHANDARDRLAALVLHRWVRLDFDGARASARGPAYVLLADGTFVNAVLVREGLARVSSTKPLTRIDELQRAEAFARTYRLGIWRASS